MEHFLHSVRYELYGKVSNEDLERIMIAISSIASDYEITPVQRELVPWENRMPEEYKIFMVTKKIEGIADGTLSNYRVCIEDFLRKVAKPLRKITSNDIVVYLYNIKKERNISNRTLDNKRSCLSSFFSWLSHNEYIDRNPVESIRPIKYERKERIPLNGTELELLRSGCKNLRDRAIMEVLYSSACRVSELVSLSIGDVDLSTGRVSLFGKGSKHRDSYLSDCALLYLKEYLSTRTDKGQALFVSKRAPHNRLTRNAVERIVKNIGGRCGVSRVHPHLMRHTAATNCIGRGMDVTQLRELLGHVSLDTTMIYAKVNKDEIRSSHKKYIA